jgi:hypothetical protein
MLCYGACEAKRNSRPSLQIRVIPSAAARQDTARIALRPAAFGGTVIETAFLSLRPSFAGISHQSLQRLALRVLHAPWPRARTHVNKDEV